MVNNLKRAKHDLGEIQRLIKEEMFNVVNDRAVHNLEELGWTTEILRAFLLELRSCHFRKHFPKMQIFNGADEIDADGYKMHFDEETLCECKRQESCCFFVKVAIRESKRSKQKVAIVSIHLDNPI